MIYCFDHSTYSRQNFLDWSTHFSQYFCGELNFREVVQVVHYAEFLMPCSWWWCHRCFDLCSFVVIDASPHSCGCTSLILWLYLPFLPWFWLGRFFLHQILGQREKIRIFLLVKSPFPLPSVTIFSWSNRNFPSFWMLKSYHLRCFGVCLAAGPHAGSTQRLQLCELRSWWNQRGLVVGSKTWKHCGVWEKRCHKPPSWGWLPTNVINSIIIRPKVVTISMGGINQPPPVMVVVCGSQGFPHEAPAEIFCTRATHSPYGIYTAYYIQYMQHV